MAIDYDARLLASRDRWRRWACILLVVAIARLLTAGTAAQ
jgi:hypothetical protein